jgi:hypothetical protein
MGAASRSAEPVHRFHVGEIAAGARGEIRPGEAVRNGDRDRTE